MEKVKLLLTPKDFKPSFSHWKIHGVLNPGGVRMKNGKIMLFVRVAEGPVSKHDGEEHCPVIMSEKEYKAITKKINKRKIMRVDGNVVYLKRGVCVLHNISIIKRVILDKSGFIAEKIEEKPILTGKPKESEYGIEDLRITKIGNKYLMTFVGVSRKSGITTSLAVSRNLKKWENKGIIFQEQNKDVVIFPEKIKGLYVALNRPESVFPKKSGIWISYSPNLIFWGKEKSLLRPRDDSWESERNGAGPPPIKTKKGWLVIYHGVKEKAGKKTYSVGAALLDLKNPEKVLMRSSVNRPLIKPTKKYEKVGFMSNVVFPTAAIFSGKQELLIYSGGADSVITVRKFLLDEIFRNMKRY